MFLSEVPLGWCERETKIIKHSLHFVFVGGTLSFHFLKRALFYFPLLVLKGIYFTTGNMLNSFPGGVSKWKWRYPVAGNLEEAISKVCGGPLQSTQKGAHPVRKGS